MSKKAITKLKNAHPTYDLNVEVVSGPQNSSTVKAFVVIFENNDKGSIIKKKASAYGTAQNVADAQNIAITEAIKNLGL